MDDAHNRKALLVRLGKIRLDDGTDVTRAERMQVERIGDLDLDRFGKWIFVGSAIAYCLDFVSYWAMSSGGVTLIRLLSLKTINRFSSIWPECGFLTD